MAATHKHTTTTGSLNDKLTRGTRRLLLSCTQEMLELLVFHMHKAKARTYGRYCPWSNSKKVKWGAAERAFIICIQHNGVWRMLANDWMAGNATEIHQPSLPSHKPLSQWYNFHFVPCVYLEAL